MGVTAHDFQQAAARETARYGADPWVFFRELLQNARDAGADRVTISTRVGDDLEEISVVDNGRGMTREHAQRFLFTLFASSKGATERMAGVFGVGFWSILAFEPDVIVLRSRVSGEANGWEVALDGRLEIIGSRLCSAPVGTSVTLSRARVVRVGALGAKVWQAVRRDAKHLRCRDDPAQLLEVVVDGRRATEALRPGFPGVEFRGPGMRGVVTLHDEPGVTLLAHGLRVRTAATAEDLLFGPGHGDGVKKTIARQGLWPQVVVDSDRLAVLMARGDVEQDRELARVARRIEDETRRLYASELNRLAPPSFLRRGFELVRAVWDRHRGVSLGVVLGVVVLASLLSVSPRWTLPGDSGPSAVGLAIQQRAPRPYKDVSGLYSGPALDTVADSQDAPDLRYSPEDARPALAAFKLVGLDEVGRPVPAIGELRPASLLDTVVEHALEIEVVIGGTGEMVRIPLPTGHLVDPASVLVDGRPSSLWYTGADEPVILSPEAASARLSYRTIEGETGREPGSGQWPSLPGQVLDRVAALRSLEPAPRVAAATELVEEMLSTRFDSETYEILRRGRARGDPLIRSALRAGGGDCDVVNAVLAAVLDAAGLGARLAVGWIGYRGAPVPGYHAWVEVDLGGGRWVVADASAAIPGTEGSGPRAEEPAPAPHGNGETATETAIPVWAPVIAICTLLGLVLALVAVWKRRFHRTFCSGRDDDPGPIVESILRDRNAWRDSPAASRRPLVAELGGGRRSLAELERAAAAGRVFAARQRCDLVDRVTAEGGVVVDARFRAGRAVMAALGAVDIDRWRRLASSASSGGELAGRVERALRANGLDVEILEAAGVSEPAESLRFPGDSCTIVLVDRDDCEWVGALKGLSNRPAEAVFRAGDVVARSLPGAGEEVSRALGKLARDAVLEATEAAQ